MLPLNLPLPLSTEMTMQSLMKEASNYLDSGRLKISYELYIEALLSAIKELQQLEFIDHCVVVENSDLSSVFTLAQTCLKQAETISLKITQRPPVPPKPYNLKIAPPLPMRPVNMTRAKSKPEFVKKPCNFTTNNVYTDMDDDDEDEEEDDYMEYDSSDEEEDDDEEVIVNTKLKASQQKRKASAPSLKLLKTSTNRPKLPRRSSTSNLSSTSAPSSPLSSVSIPINAVKSFLSLPGSMASHTTNRTGMYSVVAGDSNGPASNGDDIFLLANSTIDPNVLITVQTSNSDSLSTPTGINSNYLPMIPQAPLVTVYQSLQKQLEDALELKKKGGQDIGYANQQVLDIQSSLNRVRNIHMSATTVPTVLQFQPVLIAYQLTLIDSTIFRNIPVEAILSHAPKTPHPSIVASTDFFNYLTRLIEHAILLQQEASGRAQHINHWIKVAGKCHELKNYQTLKAVISALGTPPIQRLKRAWQFIPKKSMHLLEDLSDFMSEASNYGKYRRCLGLTQSSSEEETKNRTESEDSTVSSSSTAPSKKSSTRKNSFNEPTVPFLGIFIHDMTYLLAAQSKKKQQHNSDWKIEATSTTSDAMHQDSRVSELLRLFKNLQRSPPYSPNLSASCIKDLNKNRKRKLSHALSRNAAIKRAPAYYHDDAGELSIELQQCLVTQYLLTRSWVSEKTVDELSLVREPTKRSFSVADSLSSHQNQQVPPTPPPLTSSVSLTTTDQHHQQQQQGGILRSSSGSFTSGGSNSSNSRPISLEDDQQEAEVMDKKNTGFWLFGRKSADQGYLKETSAFGTMQRSPRHFSFEDLNRKQHATIPSISSQENNSSGTFRMNREGSQSSLASAIFRKDFWKGGSQQQQQQHSKGPLTSFNSDPSLMQRKGSTASSVSVHLSPSTSSSALFTASAVAAASAATSGNTATAAAAAAAATVTPSPSSSNRTLNNKNLRHVLSSPHPLDLSSSTSPTAVAPATTPLSEISSFNWD